MYFNWALIGSACCADDQHIRVKTAVISDSKVTCRSLSTVVVVSKGIHGLPAHQIQMRFTLQKPKMASGSGEPGAKVTAEVCETFLRGAFPSSPNFFRETHLSAWPHLFTCCISFWRGLPSSSRDFSEPYAPARRLTIPPSPARVECPATSGEGRPHGVDHELPSSLRSRVYISSSTLSRQQWMLIYPTKYWIPVTTGHMGLGCSLVSHHPHASPSSPLVCHESPFASHFKWESSFPMTLNYNNS